MVVLDDQPGRRHLEHHGGPAGPSRRIRNRHKILRSVLNVVSDGKPYPSRDGPFGSRQSSLGDLISGTTE